MRLNKTLQVKLNEASHGDFGNFAKSVNLQPFKKFWQYFERKLLPEIKMFVNLSGN